MTDLRRPLTDPEQRSGVDFLALDRDYQATLVALVAAWKEASAHWSDDLAGQIADAVDTGDLESLGTLVLDDSDAADALLQFMTDTAQSEVARAAGEAGRQGKNVSPNDVAIPDERKHYIGGWAAALASAMAISAANTAGRKALQVMGTGRPGEEVAQEVVTHLDSLSDTFIKDNLGNALMTAAAQGRGSVYEHVDPNDEAEYFASEVLDANTCGPCKAEDGHKFANQAEADAAYASGGYIGCDGGLRCRGIVVVNYTAGQQAA